MGFDIHVYTQYLENYGEPDRPHWKPKGGDTYVLTGFDHPLNADIGPAAAAIVAKHRDSIEHADAMSRTYILDWEFVSAGSRTPSERDQLEFDGRITYPDPRRAA